MKRFPEELFPNNNLIYIQDSASSHCARKVQNFLKESLNLRLVVNVDWAPEFS